MEYIDIRLTEIADRTIRDILFMEDIGLYHGKMGAAIFLYKLSRFLNNHYYSDFADELLDDILRNISLSLPIDIRSGFCGLGYGIVYLYLHRFIDGDLDDILKDIDLRICERNLNLTLDHSIETGRKGVLYYLSYRIGNSKYDKENIFPIEYIKSLNVDGFPFQASYAETMIYNNFIKECKKFVNHIDWHTGMCNIQNLGL